MQRREFNQGAAAAAISTLFGLAGCGGGGGEALPPAAAAGSVAPPAPPPAAGADPVPAPAPVPAPGPAPAPLPQAAMGTNFSGMEWAAGELRRTPRTRPNVDYSVPRVAEVAWMASQGFRRNRLPIQWELLQPMLVDTPANAAARAAIGEPGALHPAYAHAIQRVLDAHAAAGTRCILDLHNFCRYTDFCFGPDGGVAGLVRPDDPLLHAWTTDPAQVRERIFATAPGASLSMAAFADLWVRIAQRWKDHPGLGGYGIMNEPHDLPRPGDTVASPEGSETEDLMIWPAYARVAIDAIRAIDPSGPIYLAGNAWGGAMTLGPRYNPAWPLAGQNIIYEVHAYVDAYNNGAGFDWEVEVAKGYTALFGHVPLSLDTGLDRMRIATDWARQHGQRLALTETGMPIDDPRFHEAFRRLATHAWAEGIEIQSWMGGNHWTVRNHAINHAPGWHQHRTLEPLVGGMLKSIAGIPGASLFDDGPGWPEGGSVTITVYARGHLAQALTLQVASDNGGRFSKTTLTLPAGPNGEDRFTFTPEPGRVSTLTYTAVDPAGQQVPPPRKVYALADPVGHAGTSLADAAMALVAKYGACRWDLAHGHTDYLDGRLAQEGDPVRAVADSGFGSSPGNAMEMLNWMNQDGPGMGPLHPPVMRTAGGRRRCDLSAAGATGLWCKKVIPGPTFPHPRNRIPYNLADPHFSIAVVSVPRGTDEEGTVFQASAAGGHWYSELCFFRGLPQAKWLDSRGGVVWLTAPDRPVPGEPTVITLVHAPGAQRLRVNRALIASGTTQLTPTPLENLLIGWGFLGRQPQPGFGGQVYGVITGRGSPSASELEVMERYLLASAGMA